MHLKKLVVSIVTVAAMAAAAPSAFAQTTAGAPADTDATSTRTSSTIAVPPRPAEGASLENCIGHWVICTNSCFASGGVLHTWIPLSPYIEDFLGQGILVCYKNDYRP